MVYDDTKVDNVDTLPAAEYNNFVAEMQSKVTQYYDDGLTIDISNVTISVVTAGVDHDTLKNYVANDHIDWTADQGATNIHSGNYTDTDTTYTGTANIDITSEYISVVTAQVDHDTLENYDATKHFTKADLRDDNLIWTGTQQFDSTVTVNGVFTASSGSFTSAVTVNGLSVDVNTYTGAYTATTVDDVLLCNGTFTLTLPSATACVGKIFRVKNIGTGTVTVATVAGNIDGSATEVIYNQYESINICSDGSNYFII